MNKTLMTPLLFCLTLLAGQPQSHRAVEGATQHATARQRELAERLSKMSDKDLALRAIMTAKSYQVYLKGFAIPNDISGLGLAISDSNMMNANLKTWIAAVSDRILQNKKDVDPSTLGEEKKKKYDELQAELKTAKMNQDNLKSLIAQIQQGPDNTQYYQIARAINSLEETITYKKARIARIMSEAAIGQDKSNTELQTALSKLQDEYSKWAPLNEQLMSKLQTVIEVSTSSGNNPSER